MSYYSSDIYKFNNANLSMFSNSSDSNNYKLFINKDVDNYFNNIINSKSNKSGGAQSLNNSSIFSNFYSDYVHPNMLLIVLLVAVIILVIIRYFCSNIKTKNTTTTKSENIESMKNTEIESIQKEKKNEQSTNKIKKYKKKLEQEKKEIRDEKLKILEIIDELTTLNSAQMSQNTNDYNDEYIMDDNEILKRYGNNYTQNYSQNYSQNYTNSNMSLGSYENNTMNGSDYQTLNRELNSNNFIDNFYIEPPYL